MIKVYVNDGVYFAGVAFYIIDKSELDGKMHILRFTSKGVSRNEVGSMEIDLEPSFKLGKEVADGFFKEMAERASERGIKLESDLKREGQLEATKIHLEDMRKLVFESDARTRNDSK